MVPACLLLVATLAAAPVLAALPQEPGHGRAPSDTLGGFRTDEVALESASVSICPAGAGAALAYFGTINTAPSVALMTYGTSGGVREQVAAKYPFAVAVAPAPGTGGKVAVAYITSTASGLEVNLAQNRTGTWALTAVGLAKPPARFNCTGVAIEPGGAAHVIFLNATHLGHFSNSTLSFIPSDNVAPSIAVSQAGTTPIALSSGGMLQFATPWANSTGFDLEVVSTTARPDSGTRLALVYDPAGNPFIFFTSSGEALMANGDAPWYLSTVAEGTILSAACGPDGMFHVLVERDFGTYSNIQYLSGDGKGGWQTIDLGQCRPGYPAGIAVTPQGVVHIAINTALKGFLHGYRGAVPGPVQSLDATAGNKQAIINWQPPSGADSPLGFRIKRGTNASSLAPINDSPAGTTAFIDKGLSNDVTYHYSVFPYNEYGESRTSPVINVTPKLSNAKKPGAPYSLGAAVNTSGGIDLIWKAPSDDGGDRITSYKIYRGTSFEGIAYYAQTAGAATFYNDRMYAPGTTYYYKVSAINEVGEGEGSNIADCISKAVVYTLVTNVTPDKFLLRLDGTGTFDIVVKVTGNGEPMAGVTVIVDVEDRPGYTRYGLTDSTGTIRFNSYKLNPDAEGKSLTVRSSLEKLNGSASFPIKKKTVAQQVTDWMPLIYTILAGAVVLSCTAGGGKYARRREVERNIAFLEQKEHEIGNAGKMLDSRMSKPLSTGEDLSPVDGKTLFSGWKGALTEVARLGGAGSTAAIDGSKLLSSSTEYCGQVFAQEMREVIGESVVAMNISRKLTLSDKPRPVPPKEGEYVGSVQEFYMSEKIRACSDCGGAAKLACPKCHSTKKFVCPKCNSAKKLACPKCHSARRLTCPICGGSKVQACDECGGSGRFRVKCPTCASGDLPTCPRCKGRGYTTTKRMRTTHGGGGWGSDGGRYTTDSSGNRGVTTTWSQHSGYSGFEYVDDNRTCDECGGTGKTPCPTCGGAKEGTTPCKACNGSGNITCRRCSGEGQVMCQTCMGEGQVTCAECSGEGQLPCRECDDAGKVPCGPCEATGKKKDVDTITYQYKHDLLDETLSPSFSEATGLHMKDNDESLTEVTESKLEGRSPAPGEDRALFDKFMSRALERYSRWNGVHEGRLLFRSGWKVRAMPATCGEVFTDRPNAAGTGKPGGKAPRPDDDAKWPLQHRIFAWGASRRWFLQSDSARDIVTEQQEREKDEEEERHPRRLDTLRKAVMAALAVEGVVWAILVLWAAGIVAI